MHGIGRHDSPPSPFHGRGTGRVVGAEHHVLLLGQVRIEGQIGRPVFRLHGDRLLRKLADAVFLVVQNLGDRLSDSGASQVRSMKSRLGPIRGADMGDAKASQ